MYGFRRWNALDFHVFSRAEVWCRLLVACPDCMFWHLAPGMDAVKIRPTKVPVSS